MDDNRDIRDRLIRIETKLDNFGKIESQSNDAYNLSKKNEQDIKEIKSKIQDVESKEAQQTEKKGMKWDKLIDYLFYAVLAFCLYKLGVKK